MKFFALVMIFCSSLLGLALAVKVSTKEPEVIVQQSTPGISVPVNADATNVEGHPQTAVVVTQCDQLVVAYLTMPSGELVRFDQDSGLPWSTVLDMAYSATRSERVEVNCEGGGIEGYESHTPKTNI